MKLSEYSYVLPKNKIAKHPPKLRGRARLMVLDKTSGNISDKKYRDCIEYFSAGDVLVLNDTKVIKARLMAVDMNGDEHELILLERHGKHEDHFCHKVLYRGKLKADQTLVVNNNMIYVEGIQDGGIATIRSQTDLEKLTDSEGHIPLPPYMKRLATADDELRYQTVFAQYKGSVAAPTASLNMTKEILSELESRGVKIVYLTLHVGLGTFLPIRTDEITDHKMHSEWFYIPTETIDVINSAKANNKSITALGTTVARTLEYAANDIVVNNGTSSISGEADIFIYPGYKFKLVDQLITNFHAPKSTVLMLAAAFAGWRNIEAAYSHALNNDYLFLSYGDSMLIH